MTSIAVFCASSPGTRTQYLDTARAVGKEIASRGHTLVYGGASVGLMGAVADAALEAGTHVIGVFPDAMERNEIVHPQVDLRRVGSMHERKAMMTELSDGFAVLPGGLGTLEEMFEVLTWAQLGIHAKPIGLLDVDGFWNHLLTFLDHATSEGLIKDKNRRRLLSASAPAHLIDLVTAPTTPIDVPRLRSDT